MVAVVGTIALIAVQSARGQKLKNRRLIVLGVLVAAVLISTVSAGLVLLNRRNAVWSFPHRPQRTTATPP